MMPALTKRKSKLANREGMIGIVFMIPWVIGFIYFFAMPLVTSIIYSFNTVSFGNEGLVFEFVGLNNYKELLTANKEFWTDLKDVMGTLLYEVPVIVIYSMLVGLALNTKLPGRLWFRVIFFLPMIFMADVIYKVISTTGMDPSLSGSDNALMSMDFEIQGVLKNMLSSMGLSTGIMENLMGIINNIFQISWKAPIQIILYLTGLQAIPGSYYEVCTIEGATKWETFWKVTFPMLSPITLLCLVYSIIDTFTDANSGIIQLINRYSQTLLHDSMTISCCYFVIVFAYTLIVIGIVSRWVKYMD